MAAERPALNRLEVLRALKISNWEAVFSTVHATLTGGAFQTGYALWLGASNFWMGVLSAIPTFAGLVQIFSSYVVERRGERKRFTAWFSGASRILWLPILLIPFLLPRGAWFPVFVALFLLSSVFLSVPVPAFTSWLSDLVPPDHRGLYFGRRNMLAGITVMVVALPAGWFLDLAVKYRYFPERAGFGALFGMAVVFGMLSFGCLLRQAEPPMRRMEAEGTQGLRGMLRFYRAPFADRDFLRLMRFSTFFAIAQFIAAPFYTVYALEVLKLNYMWLQILGAASSLSSLLSMPLWGYLSDKFGNKPLLAISVFGTALLPVSWAFTSPNRMTASILIILTINLAGGVFWAGVGLTGFNLLIGTTPDERKSVYVAAMSAVTGLAGGIAPILGGVIMTALPKTDAVLLGVAMNSYHILFAFNTLLRFAALLTLRPVADAGATTARDVLAQLGTTRVGAFMQIRRLQRAQSQEERQQAAQALRSARTALAVEELTAALDDPGLRVREEAAQALGEIGDLRAVDALIRRLDDPASGIVGEAAEALGRIGDPRAVESLARLLQTGESADRIAAARALGRIGGAAATAALLRAHATEEEAHADVAEACASALGRIGDPQALPALTAFLRRPSRALRLAAARALGDIGDPRAAEPLLEQLGEETDAAAIAHIAVALAMVGAENAARPMLDSLDRVASPVARRQILNAAGALIGEGETFYPLLAQESFQRDEAVQRLLREMARRDRSEGRGEFGARRRDRRWERVLEKFVAGEYARAVQLLAQQVQPQEGAPPDASAAALAWAVETGERRPLQAEEFLLALFAARRLLGTAG
jgi:HEAT repeat protein/MFS family permease